MRAFGKSIVYRRRIITIALIFLAAVLFFYLAAGYESQPTHFLLAQKSAQIYSQFYNHLSDEEIAWISEGAVKEDTPPRWLNHFYDPTTGLGWQGLSEGYLPPEVVRIFAEVGLSSADAVSLVNWAHNQKLQEKYLLYEGNQTFEKAIFDYVTGNKKSAYLALGHILHLIEDATVPAHTRQDTHFDAFGDSGEPYEKWAAQNADLSFLGNLNPGQENFSCADLNDCFNKVASYSNENFFSEDTIFDSAYSKPIVAGYSDVDRYTKYALAADGTILAKITISPQDGAVSKTVDDDKIHRDYWRLLSREAVLAGIETIRIFQAESAKAEADKSLLQPPPKYSSVFKWLLTGPLNVIILPNTPLIPIVSPYGELVKIWDDISPYLKSAYNDVSEFIADIPSKFRYLFMGALPLAGPNEPENNPPGDNSVLPPAPEENNSLIEDNHDENQNAAPEISEIINQPVAYNFSDASSSSDSEVVEEILQPAAPSQITEERLNPLAPEEPAPEESSSETEELPGVGGGSSAEEENATSSEPVATTTPEVSPSVSISLAGYSLVSRQFMISWISTSSAAVFYDVEKKENFGDWENLLASTTATSTIFSVPRDLTTYYFRARAFNASSTPGDWREIAAPINFYPLAINEIAWAGTGTSSKARNDEWIELYNKTSYSLDIKNWRLVSADAGGPEIVFSASSSANTIIPANGFYLIERTDDSATSETADWFGSFGNGFNNSQCEILSLYDDSGNLVDQTSCAANNDWPAGTAAPNYQSMERVNPHLASEVPGNWQSNNLLIRNGQNVDGQPINGTPKSQNSVFNLGLFYLYPAASTTATSTVLRWTPSFINDFKDYKIIRSLEPQFGATSTIVVANVTDNEYLDATLEPQTQYYYKIAACDSFANCVESNTISVLTPEFEFFWSEPQILSESATSTDDYEPDMVLQNNNPAIVWFSRGTAWSDRTISFLQKGADNNWGGLEVVSQSYSPFSFQPHIMSRTNGFEIIFTASDQDNIGEPYDIFDWRKIDGVWQEPKNLLVGNESVFPWAAIDKDGQTHIVWEGGRVASSSLGVEYLIYYRVLAADGSFAGETQEIPGSLWGEEPKIEIDSQNRLVAIWYHWAIPGDLDKIFYSVNNLDGSGWSEPRAIADIDLWAPLPRPAELAIGKNDQALVVWDDNVYSGAIHFVSYDGATTTQNISFSLPGKNFKKSHIVTDSQKNPYIFFVGPSDSGSDNAIYFTAQKQDGSWQSIKKILEPGQKINELAAAIDANNILHLVWCGSSAASNDNYRVYYSWAKIR